MRKYFYPPLIALILSSLTHSTFPAYAQEKTSGFSDTVTLNVQNADTDEQLIQLAHAAKINVMADATDWAETIATEAKATALTVNEEQSLTHWWRDLSYLNHLTWYRNYHDPNGTFLVWREPDLASLARRVAAEAKAQRPQIEAAALPSLRQALDPALVERLDIDPQQWTHLLARYNLYGQVVYDSLLGLAKKQGWNGQDLNFRYRLENEDIPAPLRSQIILQSRLLQTQPVTKLDWLRDETWQNAKLMVERSTPSKINGQVQPRLWTLTVKAPLTGQEEQETVVVLADDQGGAQ